MFPGVKGVAVFVYQGLHSHLQEHAQVSRHNVGDLGSFVFGHNSKGNLKARKKCIKLKEYVNSELLEICSNGGKLIAISMVHDFKNEQVRVIRI